MDANTEEHPKTPEEIPSDPKDDVKPSDPFVTPLSRALTIDERVPPQIMGPPPKIVRFRADGRAKKRLCFDDEVKEILFDKNAPVSPKESERLAETSSSQADETASQASTSESDEAASQDGEINERCETCQFKSCLCLKA